MVGVTGARSAADERLLDLYRLKGDSTAPPSQQALQGLYLVRSTAPFVLLLFDMHAFGLQLNCRLL
jgi:hypothetical protein